MATANKALAGRPSRTRVQSGTRSMPTRGFAPIVFGLCHAATFGLVRQTQRPQPCGLVQRGLAFLDVFGYGFLAFALLLFLLEQCIGATLNQITVLLTVLREAASFMRMGIQ